MKVTIDLGFGSGDGDNLAIRLGLPARQIEIEALTTREVIAYLHSHSEAAREIMPVKFNPIGLFGGGWVVIVNRGRADIRYVKSDADLDIPLQQGDSVRVTSASAGG